ncbi:hypothetical protein [Streptomyces sp. NPDC040750]|uniref:hypothetical protein n=1 Tax=Streptomyces sp. NPDC040750 TaxID=3154491 RepID=UPI0033E9EBCC
MSEPDRGRLLIVWGIGALLAIGATGMFITIRDTTADLAALENSGKAFLKNLGAGNGEATCALMTRTAQSELAAAQRKRTCSRAVEALVGPLSRAERGALADAYASIIETKMGVKLTLDFLIAVTAFVGMRNKQQWAFYAVGTLTAVAAAVAVAWT